MCEFFEPNPDLHPFKFSGRHALRYSDKHSSRYPSILCTLHCQNCNIHLMIIHLIYQINIKLYAWPSVIWSTLVYLHRNETEKHFSNIYISIKKSPHNKYINYFLLSMITVGTICRTDCSIFRQLRPLFVCSICICMCTCICICIYLFTFICQTDCSICRQSLTRAAFITSSPCQTRWLSHHLI